MPSAKWSGNRTNQNLKTGQTPARPMRMGSTEGRTIKVDASSIAGAIGKATREFVKSLDRKQRFDMNKNSQSRLYELRQIRQSRQQHPRRALEA
jgi:hypothetical protein